MTDDQIMNNIKHTCKIKNYYCKYFYKNSIILGTRTQIMNYLRWNRRRRYSLVVALIGGAAIILQLFNFLLNPSLVRRVESTTTKVVDTADTADQQPTSNQNNKYPNSTHHKPIMFTFYEPDADGYCCGMLEDGHQRLLSAWRQSWQERGWDTVVLTKKDAMRHPLFPELQKKLDVLQLSDYNQKCYWRWLAMAALDEENKDEGGGGGSIGMWMSDYDTMPLELTAEKGVELSSTSGGKFTSFNNHVPCLINASPAEWERVTRLMMDVLPQKVDRNASDMISLNKIRTDLTKEDADIIWHGSEVVSTYPLKFDNEGEEKRTLVVDCEQCKGKLATHLSHKATIDTWKRGLYPESIHKNFGVINGRGEAAKILMQDYKAQCQ